MSVPVQNVYAGEKQQSDLRMAIAVRLASGDGTDRRDERGECEKCRNERRNDKPTHGTSIGVRWVRPNPEVATDLT